MIERYTRAHVRVCVCVGACARRYARACVCVGGWFAFAFLCAWVRACGCVRVCVCACGWGGLQGRRYFGARAGAMDLYDTPRTQRGKPFTFTTHLGAIPSPQAQWLFPFPSLPVILPPSYPAASYPPPVVLSPVTLLLVISFGCSCGVSLTAVEIIDGVGV